MHEFSIASAVVDTAVKHAAGRRVTVVSLRCGRLRQVVPDALEFAFGIVARETVCEGARLDQEVVAARLRCDACDRGWEIDVPAFRCPTCGTADVAVLSGEELEVESIEVSETEEAGCTV
jgi:hydrogenase nickel incorporation protein HypA/HybF